MPSQTTASERINGERANGADRADEIHRTPISCGSARTLAPTLRRGARSRRFTTPIFAPRLPRVVREPGLAGVSSQANERNLAAIQARSSDQLLFLGRAAPRPELPHASTVATIVHAC